MRLLALRLLLILLGVPQLCNAATYYISTAGADTNNGTSTATPWAHAPGMQSCTNTCGSTTPVAGDRFIFKGGETWGNANFKWTWSWSGTSGSRIYVGVDQTWFTGSTWTRPIFDAEGSVMAGSNVFLREDGSYVTIDNFEFTGFHSETGQGFGNNTMINPGSADGVIVEHCYFHGVTTSVDNIRPVAITSNTSYPTANVDFTVRYNVFSGLDSVPVVADLLCAADCKADWQAVYGGPVYFIGNVCEYLVNCYVGASLREAAYNLIYEIRTSIQAGDHGNALESLGEYPTLGGLIHDNVIHTIRAAGYVTLWVQQLTGDTTYIWNNLIYNTGIGNIINLGDSSPLINPCCGTVYVVNNTVYCGPDGDATKVCATPESGTGSVDAVIKNNHWITSNASPINGAGRSLDASNNITHTEAQASADGFTLSQTPYALFPTAPGAATVDAGANLSGLCSVMTTLCSDTLYGVVYDDSAHTATLYGRSVNIRPKGTAWDVGAYEYAGVAGGSGGMELGSIDGKSGMELQLTQR